MILVKKGQFFHYSFSTQFSTKMRLEICFNNVLDRKETFFDYKKKFFSKSQNRIFFKGVRDLSEISRGGGVGIFNLGSEIRWPIPAMGMKFANPPLALSLA